MPAQDDNLVQAIVDRIVKTADPEKIILFGSRARGDARPNSAFGVLVIKESNEPSCRRDAPLYVALADLPVEVDVLVYTPEEVAEWAQVPRAFVTTATRQGKTVYERRVSRSRPSWSASIHAQGGGEDVFASEAIG